MTTRQNHGDNIEARDEDNIPCTSRLLSDFDDLIIKQGTGKHIRTTRKMDSAPKEDHEKERIGDLELAAVGDFSSSLTNGRSGSYTVASSDETPNKDNDDNDGGNNIFSKCVEKFEVAVHGFLSRNSQRIKKLFYLTLLVAYFAYFIYCMQYRFGDEGSFVLLGVTICLVWKLMFVYMDSRGKHLRVPTSMKSYLASSQGTRLRKIIRVMSYLMATVAVLVYLSIEVFSQRIQNLQAFVGMIIMTLVCFILSKKPSKVNWHPVFWSFFIQFVIALLTLRTQFGRNMFEWIGDQIKLLFSFSDAGSSFVIDKDFKTMGLALSSTGLLIFTNSLIYLLNHWGVIEFIVIKLGWFLAVCLETGPVESVVAAANIFLGLAEAPLLVKPYLKTVTLSELHTIMACGFASISGAMMGLFVRIGAPPNHLLTAAVISAPAALAISKLMYPETEVVILENQRNIRMRDEGSQKESNSLNSFSEGAVFGTALAVSVWSNMLAFVSILELLNALVGWLGERAGFEGLTFEMICSFLLFPLAFCMGVDVEDCSTVGGLIGVKLFATPVIGYQRLGILIQNRNEWESYTQHDNQTWHWSGSDVILEATNVTLKHGMISERSEVIATYAMCGFSAFTAIGICLGSLTAVCPPRKSDITKTVVRAFFAGNMASFATGAVSGVMYSGAAPR